uniref:Uncharacterized protein n=1 Tax=Mesocestoides corti TaxID=53468 RepID=A0A5K3ETU6_MESCO
MTMCSSFWFLVILVGSSVAQRCHLCDQNCRTKFSVPSVRISCFQGCRFSSGSQTELSESGVNAECEKACSSLSSDDMKAACYDGCTYIPVSNIMRPSNSPFSFSGIMPNPVISSIISMFRTLVNKQSESDNGVVHRLRVQVLVPNDEIVETPSHPADNELLMMNSMSNLNGEALENLRMVMGPPQAVDTPTFGNVMCHRVRAVIRHLTAHPLVLVSIILMFFTSTALLVFMCIRLNARRARRAIFRRQFKRMPAFFKPASVRVSLLSPQPATEEDASELPPKLPIA